MKTISFRAFALGVLLPITTISAAGTEPSATFQSADNKTSLLELYSSEGCSSCPPAEAWLSSLTKSPALWKDYVPVCFHVDYWDYLGWRDIFSSPQFTERQKFYAHELRMESIYTPGFILDGKEWKGWYNSQPIPRSSSKSGVLKVVAKKSLRLEITYTPPAATSNQWRVEAVVLAMNVKSKVTAGENSGKTLQHDFAVISRKTQGMAATAGQFTAILNMPAPTGLAADTAIAVWVEHENEITAVQATGGMVPAELLR